MTWWRWLVLALIAAGNLVVLAVLSDFASSAIFVRVITNKWGPDVAVAGGHYGCYFGQFMLLAMLTAGASGKPLLRLGLACGLSALAWLTIATSNIGGGLLAFGGFLAFVHWGMFLADLALVRWIYRRWNARLVWPGQVSVPVDERMQFAVWELLIVVAIVAGLFWFGPRVAAPVTVEISDFWNAGIALALLIPLHWLATLPMLAIAFAAGRNPTDTELGKALWQSRAWRLFSGDRLPWELYVNTVWMGLCGSALLAGCTFPFAYVWTQFIDFLPWLFFIFSQGICVAGNVLLLRALGFRLGFALAASGLVSPERPE